jgi:hypothetical protein
MPVERCEECGSLFDAGPGDFSCSEECKETAKRRYTYDVLLEKTANPTPPLTPFSVPYSECRSISTSAAWELFAERCADLPTPPSRLFHLKNS